MLVLSRRPNESIVIGANVVLRVLAVNGNRVRLGIDAPTEVSIRRLELQASLSQSSPIMSSKENASRSA